VRTKRSHCFWESGVEDSTLSARFFILLPSSNPPPPRVFCVYTLPSPLQSIYFSFFNEKKTFYPSALIPLPLLQTWRWAILQFSPTSSVFSPKSTWDGRQFLLGSCLSTPFVVRPLLTPRNRSPNTYRRAGPLRLELEKL